MKSLDRMKTTPDLQPVNIMMLFFFITGFFQHNGDKPKLMTIVTRRIRNDVLKMALNTDARNVPIKNFKV